MVAVVPMAMVSEPSPAAPDDVSAARVVTTGVPASKRGRQLSKRKTVMFSPPAAVSWNQIRKNSRVAPSGMVSNWASAKFSTAFVAKMSSTPVALP